MVASQTWLRVLGDWINFIAFRRKLDGRGRKEMRESSILVTLDWYSLITLSKVNKSRPSDTLNTHTSLMAHVRSHLIPTVCTHIGRSAPPRPRGALHWSHCTDWSGTGTSPSSPGTRWQSATRRRKSPSACFRPAWAPPCPLATTGWWALAFLKQGTPAPLCHPRGPPGGTCPGGLSGWGELRKRKTEEGLIWGSRKSAGGVRGNGHWGGKGDEWASK